MNIDKNIVNENELKRKEITEKEQKQELKKQLEFKKTKEKISVEIEIEDEIFHLKELMEKGVISNEVAKKIVSGKEFSETEINEIFKKIDEIDEIKDVEKYLPKELRVSKEDYLKALNDDIFRLQLITRIDSSLALLSMKINPDHSMGLNLFSGFLIVLDKSLIKIQENTIDVKDNLKSIDKKKGLYLDNRTNWKKILDFLKEIIK